MAIVRNLQVGDLVKFKEIVVVVREMKYDRAVVSKNTAKQGHGLFSIPFSSPNFEDLQQRVVLA